MFEEDLQVRAERTDSNRLIKRRDNGEVAERSIAADCKSAAQRATEVRTLPSPPTFITPTRAKVASAGKGWWARGLPSCVSWPPRCARRQWWPRAKEIFEQARRCQRGERGVGRPRRSDESARSQRGEREGGSNSVVESQPSKLLVAGSIPVSRSSLRSRVPSARELRLGKPGVA